MMLGKGVREMPKVGDKEFDYTPEGVAEAKQYSADTGIPMTNAMDRNIKEYAGGGKVGYDSIGRYNEGGKVKGSLTSTSNTRFERDTKEHHKDKARYKKIQQEYDDTVGTKDMTRTIIGDSPEHKKEKKRRKRIIKKADLKRKVKLGILEAKRTLKKASGSPVSSQGKRYKDGKVK